MKTFIEAEDTKKDGDASKSDLDKAIGLLSGWAKISNGFETDGEDKKTIDDLQKRTWDLIGSFDKKEKKESILSEAKEIDLPGINLSFLGFARDVNGNHVVRLSTFSGKRFSIQTNGNLPYTHKNASYLNSWGEKQWELVTDEVVQHIEKYLPAIKATLRFV